MNPETLQVLQRELTCSICMNYFRDPVTLDCGHSFCRACLWLYWDGSPPPMCCPRCKQVPEKANFKTNIQLRDMAALRREARADAANGSEELICVAHDEGSLVFCDAEKSLLCGPCSDSLEHMLHNHRPVQSAAEEFRVSRKLMVILQKELRKRMDTLWNMAEEMQNTVKIEASKAESLEEYVALRKVMIRAEYQKIHKFLCDEERLHLDMVERESKEINHQLEESKIRMTGKTESLRGMFRELLDMSHKPDLELLQELGTVLERAELVLNQMPQPVNSDLTSWSCNGLLEMLNKYKVADVLSHGTINLCMNLSEDIRNMLFGNNRPNISREPQKVRSFATWGTHTFTSGKHYWEAEVPRDLSWVLGVCKDIIMRETDFVIDFEEASFLFSLKLNDHYYLSTNRPLLVHHVKMPVGKIGVFLDYDKGIVSFHDASNGSLLCSLASCSFSYPLKPFLCFEAP
ncbi:tripartite motif-containing protein 64C-like [Pipistrellus kuhlii]|uniref:tripartite motif-containing protein 64C-like n=1 Tax=Pipistrellus kuhlii TaxID=59472 RepID=UPI00174F6BC3|nr:tripartite motif-containing protein 64C-like [Pipistrellus kuhlii]